MEGRELSRNLLWTWDLARLVKAKRGTQSLRDIAPEVKVSAATLSRVEARREPDMVTFLRLCEWLGMSPNEVLSWTVGGWIETAPATDLLRIQANLLDVARDLNSLAEAACIRRDEQ